VFHAVLPSVSITEGLGSGGAGRCDSGHKSALVATLLHCCYRHLVAHNKRRRDAPHYDKNESTAFCESVEANYPEGALRSGCYSLEALINDRSRLSPPRRLFEVRPLSIAQAAAARTAELA
jgi:hypothetical protein